MGAYNVKVIEYSNGGIQVRRYSRPLKRKEPNDYEEELVIGENVDPFTLCKFREIDSFDELDKKSHASKEDNELRSFNRTKQKIYEYSRSAKWEKFITITFNPDKVDRFNYGECSRIVRQWLHNQRRNAPDLQYLFVPELHKDGAIHFHGLLANTGNIKFVDSGKRTSTKQIIYNMKSWTYGFTTSTDVTNIHSVSKYIGKYITKELCAVSTGQQRYFVSQNLSESTASTFIVDNDEDFNNLLQTLNDSFGTETVHVSKPRKDHNYVDVDYYELQERKTTNDCTTSI